MNGKLIYLLYRALQWLGFPFIVLYFLIRGLRDRRYFRRFGERLGFLPEQFSRPVPGAIWIHAVSVGEVLSAPGLLRGLRQAFPSAPLFVSTTTLAGRAIADQKLASLASGVFYAPIDYCFAVRRVLRTIRPAAVVILETEIWPNLIRESKRAGCALVIVNGRISDRALPRYHRLRWFFRPVLNLVDRILVQTDISRVRFVDIGASKGRVVLGGNLKYDFEPSSAGVAPEILKFLESVQPGAVWIAASTMAPAEPGDPDEDDAVIAAFRELAQRYPRLLLIHVPRKPERFDVAAGKLEEAGISFIRRSALAGAERFPELPCVLLLDSIGELSALFACADVVFMGGTLPHRGGHNILEPAFFGRPVIIGPHMENFPEIASEFIEQGACVSIERPERLAAAVEGLLTDADLRTVLGERARKLAEARRGATARAIHEIHDVWAEALPVYRPAFPLYQFFWGLSALWWLGGIVKRWINRAGSQRLSTPVVSVGSISIGGSGKTPFVLWLAERLKESGYSPAFLTRGYRRRVPEKHTILAPGATVSPLRTGDEAQILLRSGVGPMGIGADRAATGRLVEERFHPDVFVLDDGFQHWRLDRDLDIVLIDGLAPYGSNGRLVPLGRLREPMSALSRAAVFVVTRTEPGRNYQAVVARLRHYNRTAPVFFSRVVAQDWVDAQTGERIAPRSLAHSRVGAFCGLANPASFWHALGDLDIRTARCWTFADHKQYRPLEVRRLAKQARSLGIEALLTTQKDMMNLSEGATALLSPLKLYWLRIDVEVDGANEFLSLVKSRIRREPREADV
ncbi:MAG: tetraacyldisaccharide 4'-kinase [Bryobacteraceae bacterium]